MEEPNNSSGLVCPGCGYNLTALTMNRCPECGQEFRIAGPLPIEAHPLRAVLNRIAFGFYVVGTGLICLSWFHAVTWKAGWAGFAISIFGSILYSVARRTNS